MKRAAVGLSSGLIEDPSDPHKNQKDGQGEDEAVGDEPYFDGHKIGQEACPGLEAGNEKQGDEGNQTSGRKDYDGRF
jgi:hypothetical protein